MQNDGNSSAPLLHWIGTSVTDSGYTGNTVRSAEPDDNFGRQFWRQFSLIDDTSAIIFQNENCPAIIFGSCHQGLLGRWGRRQFWATILGDNFDHNLGCYSGVVWAQTGQRSAREMQPSQRTARAPPPPVRKLPCLASQGKYQPQQVIFKMNIKAAVSTKRLHRQMAQGSK